MKPPRVSIAGVMAVVAILAVNMAAVRTLHAYDSELGQGLALTGFAVQYGIFRAIRGRGRTRAAWVVFAASGSVTMAAFAWAVAFPGSMLSDLLIVYTKHTNRFLNSLTHVWNFYNRTQMYPVLVITLALVWSVPQLILASAVGLAARMVLGRHSKIT